MDLAVWTLLGAGLVAGQPPQDYQAYRTRALKFELAVEPEDRAKVRQIELHASEDQGQVWNVEATVKPDAAFLPFNAKKDGTYWVKMVVVFTDGKTDPPDVASAPPFQKILIDTSPPHVRINTADRAGDEIAVSWSVEDRHPNDAKTRFEYRPAGAPDTAWKAVPVTGADRRSTRFKPDAAIAVQVRVTAEDLAGNTYVQTRDVPSVSTSGFAPPPDVSPAAATAPAPSPVPAGGLKLPDAGLVVPSVTSPPVIGPADASPPPPVAPMGLTAPIVNLTPPEPKPPVQPPAAAPLPASPIAVGSGVTPVPDGGVEPRRSSPATTTVGELPPPQVINFTRFELPYQLDAGPSGVSRIDLYVTRDDGKTWTKWSEHGGKESPLKVNLEGRLNPQKEGVYGFRLVPVSGAGLTDGAPTAGTPPDFRIEVDETPPLIQIFTPEADPAQRDVLILKWAVRDKSMVRDTVGLEWGEGPNGPWCPVSGGDGAVLAAGGVGGTTNRVPNTGTYAWRVPATLPAHKVHLKMTAWDAAGNKSEVVTPPVLVDLTKPRARIQGVMQPAGAKP